MNPLSTLSEVRNVALTSKFLGRLNQLSSLHRHLVATTLSGQDEFCGNPFVLEVYFLCKLRSLPEWSPPM